MSRVPSSPVAFKVERAAAARQTLASERRARWKTLGLNALRLVAAMGVSALLVAGTFWLMDQAGRSALFEARKVRFRGLVHAREAELLTRSGLKAGQNIFRADLAAGARGVESSPWVVSASVSRSFPPAFEVEIVEHVPAARVSLGKTYLVDIEARVFKQLAADDPPDVQVLPLVTGLGRTDWESKREATQLRLGGALQLIDAWAAEGLAPGLLLEIRAEEGASFSALARTGDQPHDLRIGGGPFRPKLRRYAQVRAALARRGEKAGRIDLDNQTRPEWVAAQLTTEPNLPARRP